METVNVDNEGTSGPLSGQKRKKLESESVGGSLLLERSYRKFWEGGNGLQSQLVRKEEPMLLANKEKYIFVSNNCPEAKKQVELMWSMTWFPSEISFKDDVNHWKTLTKKEQHFISDILAFFATADGIIMENLNKNFSDEVQWSEIRAMFTVQAAQEVVHADVYAQAITNIISDESKRNELFNGIETRPSVKAKAQWAQQWLNQEIPFEFRIMAFAIIECLFFPSSFCGLFWLKKRGLCPGLCFSNEFISRDETVHVNNSLLVLKTLKNKVPKECILEMVQSAVKCEDIFIEESLPEPLLGINEGSMKQYIRFVADYFLGMLNLEKHYKVSNPYDFMHMISLEEKTNMFEKKSSEYSKAKVFRQFSLDAEF